MNKNLAYVIHKHDATRLHYDFRLEIGKVMPSWAIAKGPTLDPTKKRLAQMTNNHALEYRHFEGIIPKGGYGAGPVMIWDEGIYFPEVEVAKGVRDRIEDFQQAQRIMKEGLKKGELKFFLQGKKLQGSFALVKVSNFGEKSWLLIKHADNYVQKDYDANEYDFSATTHRSIKQILSGAEELQ